MNGGGLTRPQVILVHGLWMTGVEMAVLGRRLRAGGFEVHRFRYSSLRMSPRDNARRLGRFMDALAGDIVHLVGHSLGWLVICWLMHDSPLQRPGRVVMLGTPYNGSRVAARLVSSRHGRWLIGRASEHGLLGDPAPWRGLRELGVIAGVARFGVGRLFAPLSAPHDGTVEVSETRVPGMTDFVMVRANHLRMLFTRETARQVGAFLRDGRFLHTACEAV